MNYRKFNDVIIKNKYSLSLIDESLKCLNKTKTYTQLNFIVAYHKMRIKKNDEWKTAFKIKYDLFYQILFFDLINVFSFFKFTSIKFCRNDWMSMLLYIWMIFWFISKIRLNMKTTFFKYWNNLINMIYTLILTNVDYILSKFIFWIMWFFRRISLYKKQIWRYTQLIDIAEYQQYSEFFEFDQFLSLIH